MGFKRAAATAAGCAVVAAAGLAVNSGAQDPGPPTGTLDVFQRNNEVKVHTVDVAPKQTNRRPFTPGDMVFVRGPLRNQAKERVGRAQVTFVATTAGRDVEARVSATFMLGDGHIVVEGTDLKGTTVDTVAIVGGTGRYAGAEGTLEVRPERNRTRFRFTFVD